MSTFDINKIAGASLGSTKSTSKPSATEEKFNINSLVNQAIEPQETDTDKEIQKKKAIQSLLKMSKMDEQEQSAYAKKIAAEEAEVVAEKPAEIEQAGPPAPELKKVKSDKKAEDADADYSDEELLAAIRQVESSGGEDLEHAEMKSGLHKGTSAYANYGLMPITMRDIIENYGKKDFKDYKYLVKDLSEAIEDEKAAKTDEEKAEARERIITEAAALKENIAELDEGKEHTDTLEYKMAQSYFNFIKRKLKDEIKKHGYKVVGYAWLNGPGNVKKLLKEEPETVLDNYYPKRMYKRYLAKLSPRKEEIAEQDAETAKLIPRPGRTLYREIGERPAVEEVIEGVVPASPDAPAITKRPTAEDDTDVVTIGEMQRMMRKYGVPMTKLSEVKEMARYYGAETPGSYDKMAEAKGQWADIVLLGLPQKLSILTEEDEDMAELADELRATALYRKATGQVLGELGLGMLMPQMLVAKGVKSMLAVGAGTGFLAGVGASRTGEEIEQGLIGGSIGLVLTGAIAGVSKYAFRRGRVPKPVMEEVEEVSDTIKKLPEKKKIEMAEEVEKVWQDPKNVEAAERMDAHLTKVFAEGEKAEDAVPSFDQWKLDMGLRKPPKLKVKKVPRIYDPIKVPKFKYIEINENTVSKIPEPYREFDYLLQFNNKNYAVKVEPRGTRGSRWTVGQIGKDGNMNWWHMSAPNRKKLNEAISFEYELRIQKEREAASIAGEDYVIEIGEDKWYVYRPNEMIKEWRLGELWKGQMQYDENFRTLSDLKQHLFERYSKPTKKVDFLRQLTDEQVKLVKEQGAGLLPKHLREEGVDPAVWLAYNNFVGEIGRLKKWLGVKTDAELLDEIKIGGDGFILDQYKRSVTAVKLRDYLEREKLIGDKEWGGFRRFVNHLIDVKYVARQFDEKLGSDFEQTIDTISEKLNTISYIRAGALKRMARLRKVMKKSGMTNDEVYEFLDTGKRLQGLDRRREYVTYKGEQVNVLDEWRYFFNDLLEDANQMGLPITKLKNYVPRQRPDTVEYVRKLDAKLKEANLDTGQSLLEVDIPADKFSKLVEASPNLKQLVIEMSQILGEKPKTTADFRRLFGILTNPNDIQVRRITEAKAAIQRSKDTIPDWIREKNLFQLTKNWTSNTFRHAALRNELADLDLFKTFARNQGDSWTAKYVDDLQRDIVGTRTDGIARSAMKSMQLFEIKLNRVADRLDEQGRDWTANGVRSLTYVPEVYQMLAQSIYPNLLGGSVRAAIQNILSAPVMSAPELGPAYGSFLSTKAAMRLATRPKVELEITAQMASVMKARLGLNSADMTKSKAAQLRKLEEAGILTRTDSKWEVNIGAKLKTADSDLILGTQGILPAQWTGELSAQLRSELKRSSLYHFTAGTYEKWTKMSMAMFEASERMARMQTYHIANDVAADFIAGKPAAQKWFSKLSSPSYVRRIQKAKDMGDDEQVRHLIQRYFQSTNMFNYDRANMSSYGRYLGPVFSTFSKWPTSIAGRVMHELYDRRSAGMKKLGVQLLAPFMIMSAIDAWLEDPDTNPRIRALFGTRGIASVTPFTSFQSFIKLDFASPPIFQVFKGFIEAVEVPDEKTPSRISKVVQTTASTFGPGANILRIAGEDIPQLMGVNIRKRARGPLRKKGKIERQLIEAERLLK